MSSVLKALKKLEEEKRGGAAPAAPTSQRWASGGQPEFKGRLWLVAGSGLAVALLIVLVLLWAGRKPSPAVKVAVETPAAETVAVLPVRPEAPVDKAPARVETPPTQVAISSTAPPPRPAPQREIPRSAPQPPPAAPAPVVNAPPVTIAPPPPVPAMKIAPEAPAEIPVRQVQVNRVEIPAPGQEWVAPQQLSVSEILPPVGGERMAIVNGLPVMAGTMVEEALVEEIHDDRVVFAIGGKRVTVPLHKDR